MPITPAPSLVELYNFQERFEEAATAIIEAAQLPVIKPHSEDNAPLEAVWVGFSVGSARENRLYDSQERGHYAYYRACQLSVKIRCPRDDNGTETGEPPSAELLTKMARVVSKVRVLFAEFAEPFTPTNTAYYVVTRLAPVGESLGFEPDYMCDTAELRWSMDFEILPEAFPVI